MQRIISSIIQGTVVRSNSSRTLTWRGPPCRPCPLSRSPGSRTRQTGAYSSAQQTFKKQKMVTGLNFQYFIIFYCFILIVIPIHNRKSLQNIHYSLSRSCFTEKWVKNQAELLQITLASTANSVIVAFFYLTEALSTPMPNEMVAVMTGTLPSIQSSCTKLRSLA